jgi:hypothetical protein
MKIFHKKDGGVIQLIDKEKMKNWPTELPLLFIEYIRSNQLDQYGDVKKQVETYLEEVMSEVAIPRLISVLEGENEEEIILALTRIEEISKKKVEMAKPIKTYLENLKNNRNKTIINLANNIEDNFAKAERKKELAKKRKIMQEKEKDFLDGKISAEDYATARKDYLLLKE